MRYYRSKDGDTADSIVWTIYGRQNDQLVEQMIEANPGLADLGPALPAGLRLVIPDAPAPASGEQVRLWS